MVVKLIRKYYTNFAKEMHRFFVSVLNIDFVIFYIYYLLRFVIFTRKLMRNVFLTFMKYVILGGTQKNFVL